MANPSLLIIPDRYKAAKLYSQLPESGDGDFTVTRSTTATRVNASGLIESVASGVPRLDYTGGGCPSLLVEPAATNLFLRSEEFDDAYWTKALTTITSTSELDPSGLNTADKIVVDNGETIGSTSTYTRSSAVTLAIGSTPTISFFVKKGGFDRVSVRMSTSATMGAGPTLSRTIDLNTLQVTAGTLGTFVGAFPAANGFVRLVFQTNAIASATNYLGITPADSSVSVGNGVDGIIVWGAQLETGSVATSYIPTVASTVTRNADVISLSSVSGLIGQSEGSLYAEVNFSNLQANNVRILTVRESANSSNFFQIERATSAALRITARLNSGSTINFLTHPNAAVAGTNKIAFAYADGNYALALNGVVATSAQAGMTASLNQIFLGQDGFASAATFLNDRISAAALYTTRLSNSELASLTQL